MFAPAFATPFTSFAPMPPTPMQATSTVSLGARWPRPSTCRGTMVNAKPAPTSPTNLRLEMRLRAMILALLSPPPRAAAPVRPQAGTRSEEHTSELQSLAYLVCRLLLEKKKNTHHAVHACELTAGL